MLKATKKQSRWKWSSDVRRCRSEAGKGNATLDDNETEGNIQSRKKENCRERCTDTEGNERAMVRKRESTKRDYIIERWKGGSVVKSWREGWSDGRGGRDESVYYPRRPVRRHPPLFAMSSASASGGWLPFRHTARRVSCRCAMPSLVYSVHSVHSLYATRLTLLLMSIEYCGYSMSSQSVSQTTWIKMTCCNTLIWRAREN